MECNYAFVTVFSVVKNFITVVQIVGPILMIISLAVSLIRLMANPTDTKLPKHIRNAAFALVLLFLVPLLIGLTLNLVDNRFNFTACLELKNDNTNHKFVDDKKYKNTKVVEEYDKYESGSKFENSKEKTGSGGMAIPYYLQYDERWGDIEFYDIDTDAMRSLASGGCEHTAFAMVVSYLKGKAIYPSDVYNKALPIFGNGHMIIYDNNFATMSNAYGITPPRRTENWNEVVTALKNKQPVIGHYGPGTFTNGGHFIVIRGVTSDGKFLVNDPTDNTGFKKDYLNRKFTTEEMTTSHGNWMAWFIFDKKK